MKRFILYGFLAFSLINSGFFGCSQKYDLLIKSGEIYDGSGNDPNSADVGIVGDRIVAVGKLSSNAPKVIQAQIYVQLRIISQENPEVRAGKANFGHARSH